MREFLDGGRGGGGVLGGEQMHESRLRITTAEKSQTVITSRTDASSSDRRKVQTFVTHLIDDQHEVVIVLLLALVLVLLLVLIWVNGSVLGLA